MPQDDSIFRKLTVEQNLRAILEYLKLSRSERESRITKLLGQFGLEDKRKQMAGTLSGGERRRLEIARCLASKPSLILLDEPFTGIDPVTIHSIQDIIADLCSSGIAVLLTDHRERETLTVTDRSYIVCAGKVVVSGNAETVLSDPTAMELYFGRRFDAASIIEGKQSFGTNPRPEEKDEAKSDESSQTDKTASEPETNKKQPDAEDETRDQAA